MTFRKPRETHSGLCHGAEELLRPSSWSRQLGPSPSLPGCAGLRLCPQVRACAAGRGQGAGRGGRRPSNWERAGHRAGLLSSLPARAPRSGAEHRPLEVRSLWGPWLAAGLRRSLQEHGLSVEDPLCSPRAEARPGVGFASECPQTGWEARCLSCRATARRALDGIPSPGLRAAEASLDGGSRALGMSRGHLGCGGEEVTDLWDHSSAGLHPGCPAEPGRWSLGDGPARPLESTEAGTVSLQVPAVWPCLDLCSVCFDSDSEIWVLLSPVGGQGHRVPKKHDPQIWGLSKVMHLESSGMRRVPALRGGEEH